MDKKLKLKLCPFCGSLPDAPTVSPCRNEFEPSCAFYVECEDCGCVGPTIHAPSGLDDVGWNASVAAWNERV